MIFDVIFFCRSKFPLIYQLLRLRGVQCEVCTHASKSRNIIFHKRAFPFVVSLFFRPFMCLSVCTTCLSVVQCDCLQYRVSVCMYYMSVCSTVYLSVVQCICLYVLHVCLQYSVSVCSTEYLSVCTTCLSVVQCICLQYSVSVCSTICLSVCLNSKVLCVSVFLKLLFVETKNT